jgi:hypothetical protein
MPINTSEHNNNAAIPGRRITKANDVPLPLSSKRIAVTRLSESDGFARIQMIVTAHATRSYRTTAKKVILGTSFAPVIVYRASQIRCFYRFS